MRIDEHTVESASGKYSRKVWLLKSAEDKSQKLCVFLDAEYYLNHMNTPSVLMDLQAQNIIPPVSCLFVSHVNGESRHADYTCNPHYSEFIAKEVIRWAQEQNDGISENNNLICGLSLSGLASAYLTLTYPQTFSCSLCQSGSFWWNEEWLAQNAPSCVSAKPKFWISVGDQETTADISHPPTGMRQAISQVAASEAAAKKLMDLGAEVNYHLFSGGHEMAPWQKELPDALHWLIGSNR